MTGAIDDGEGHGPTTAAVPDSTNKRYVTDAELTVIGNTSGTNTGDQTSVSGNAGTATKLATARNIDGQSFDGTANITVIAPGTHAATSKATPVDADELPLADSAASFVLKKLTWANLKATLKTYLDTLYPSGSGTSTGTNTGDQTITLTGDVTGSGTGSFAASIGVGKVTSAMIADGTIVNADVNASAALAISKLADPTAGKVIGSAGSAAAAVFPPGYELNYTEITSNVNVTSTTEASGTTIISPGAITFDGTPVLCHFTAKIVLPTATSVNDFVFVSLFEGATQITRLTGLALGNLTTGQLFSATVPGFYRFTPTAGAHTYTVTAWTNSTTGTPQVAAGSGGTGGTAPAFVRFTKV